MMMIPEIYECVGKMRIRKYLNNEGTNIAMPYYIPSLN